MCVRFSFLAACFYLRHKISPRHNDVQDFCLFAPPTLQDIANSEVCHFFGLYLIPTAPPCSLVLMADTYLKCTGIYL